jgi:hypothetical protein
MAIVAMIFTLIVLAMIGGFILLFPLSRQEDRRLKRPVGPKGTVGCGSRSGRR